MTLANFLKEHGIVVGHAEVRRLIMQGAIMINDERPNDIGYVHHVLKPGDVVKVGKKHSFIFEEKVR